MTPSSLTRPGVRFQVGRRTRCDRLGHPYRWLVTSTADTQRLLEGHIEQLQEVISGEVLENIGLQADILLLEGKIAYMEREWIVGSPLGSSSNPFVIE